MVPRYVPRRNRHCWETLRVPWSVRQHKKRLSILLFIIFCILASPSITLCYPECFLVVLMRFVTSCCSITSWDYEPHLLWILVSQARNCNELTDLLLLLMELQQQSVHRAHCVHAYRRAEALWIRTSKSTQLSVTALRYTRRWWCRQVKSSRPTAQRKQVLQVGLWFITKNPQNRSFIKLRVFTSFSLIH
jgi:hypothetical protein